MALKSRVDFIPNYSFITLSSITRCILRQLSNSQIKRTFTNYAIAPN